MKKNTGVHKKPKNEVVELTRKLMKGHGKGAINKLPRNIRELEPFPYKDQLWLVGGDLDTWVREKGGWRHLGPQNKKLWLKTKLPEAEGRDYPFLAGDRLLCVSTAGRVFELIGERWSLIHRPGKEIPIQAAKMAWDPLKERIVVWHGGKVGSPSWARAQRTTTYAFEKGEWRLIFEEQIQNIASKGHVFFDRVLGHIVRVWYEGVGVLIDDRWELYRPKNYEPDWQHVYQDELTGEVLTEHVVMNGSVYEFEYARVDLANADVVAFLGDSPLKGATAPILKALEKAEEATGYALWYDPHARATISEPRSSPQFAIVTDLRPAFEAAQNFGPKKKPGGGKKPKPPKLKSR